MFIPADFDISKKNHYSLITFLHGAGDGAFDVANAQSLPRLLGPECWKGFTFRPPNTPDFLLKYDNCTFTQDFKQVVFLPSSGTPSHWHGTMFSTVAKILKDVIYPRYNIDPRKNTLIGQSAGGRGLFDFASMYPDIFAALVPVCV